MPVPTLITDLSETPSVNSPADSETVGPSSNNYIQSLSAFIRQIYDGALKPLAAFNLNGQKLSNVAPGTIGSSSTDVLTAAQTVNLAQKYGELRMWWGTATQAAVAATWGPGWYLCNGQSGTPNLMDRMPLAAGQSYATGAEGGASVIALSTYHLPVHAHGVNDPSHAHSIADGGHAHGVNDPGHIHTVAVPMDLPSSPGSYNSVAANHGQSAAAGSVVATAGGNGTGISIALNGTGIGIYGAATGISIQNAGSGGAFSVQNPFFACCFIMYLGGI